MKPMDVLLITGMSGSGKSVALHALEDSGYFCIDNLPPELLIPLVKLELEQDKVRQLGIAIDMRSADSLDMLPEQLAVLREMGLTVKTLFLDAASDVLLRRFSETRRKHPLSGRDYLPSDVGLAETIELEREMLAELREHAHVIDTGLLRAAQLQSYVKTLIGKRTQQMTLVFESFAFKRGVPIDADYVFDVRMLPNPHYESHLRPLTGRDEPIKQYLLQFDEVQLMQQQISDFLSHWIPHIERDHRSYVTVSIGCTGGQHRSVYLVEQLVQAFSGRYPTLKRHRELDAG